MSETDALLALIKSLNSKELRFIKKFAETKQKRPNKILALLDAMSKDSVDTELRKEYKGLNVLRFKLKNLILKALRSMDVREDIEYKIAVHRHNENIYYSKGFYGEAIKELESAEELARNHQDFGNLLPILILKQHRSIERVTKGLIENVDANAQDLMTVLEKYRAEIQSMIKYQVTFARYRFKDQQAFGPVSLPPLPPDLSPTFTHTLYHNLTESLVARSQGNFDLARKSLSQIVDSYDKTPFLRAAQLNRYKILLANYATLLITNQEFEKAKETVNKLETIPDEDFNGKAETFQSTAHLRLLIVINTVDYSGFKDLIDWVKHGLKTYSEKINQARRFSIWYNLMAAFFIKEDFANALKWLDTILLNKRHRIREEIQYATRIIELALHYEHANFLGIEGKIVALKRYLERKDETTQFKMAVLSSFQALAKSPSFRDSIPLFTQLVENLESISNSDSNLDRLGLSLIQAWGKSKMSSLSIAESLQSLQ